MRYPRRAQILSKYYLLRISNIYLPLARNYFLKLVTEGKVEERLKVRGRREIRSKQLLDDLKDTRGYLTLKEESLAHTLRVTYFGSGYGPVVR
jgi:hypothetical protein